MTKLQKVSLGIALLGGLAAVGNFFRLYGLAGQCSSAGPACGDDVFNTWRLHELVAIGVGVAGLALFLYTWLRRPRP